MIIVITPWLYFYSDRRQIWGIFDEIKQNKDNCAVLYEYMTPSYRKMNTQKEFAEKCGDMWLISSPDLDINWPKTSARIQPGLWNGGAVIQFKKIDDRWYLEGIVDWYYD